jgi:PAS domain S-box-containing protein
MNSNSYLTYTHPKEISKFYYKMLKLGIKTTREKMKKTNYSLDDIGKLLTYIPQIFLILLATLFIIISYFVTQYKETSEINKFLAEQKYSNEKTLSNYISQVNKKIDKYLLETEQELKKNVHITKGLLANSKDINEVIEKYIKDFESKKSIKFVIFDTNLNIIYGKQVIQKLENLIFNQKGDETYIGLTLLYLSSQGESTSFSWKDDAKQTIQLSFLEKSFDNKYFIGAFSLVDYQEHLIQKAFINDIRENSKPSQNYYFWLYDKARKNAFNLKNDKKWQIAVGVHKRGKTFYNFEKYELYVGITQKREFINKKIEEIKSKYQRKHNFNTFAILMSTIILIAFATLFSSFIKRIFTTYNRNFASKNKQLKRIKQRYELAIIASNDGLWDRNLRTNTIFFSKKWLDMLGYRAGEIKHYDEWLNLLHVKDREKIEKVIDDYINSNKEDHLICEYRLKMKSGKYKWILARGKVFRDEKENQKRLLMMTMDIDDKKEATKHLQELVKKEVAKNEEKQRLLIQQNKLAAMGEMIGAIAHQWRQPLNNISLIIHFIRDSIKSEHFKKELIDSYVQNAKEQIEYMSETIDDFRNFYKPSKEKLNFDIKKAIQSTIDIMKTQIDKYNIEINLKGKALEVVGYENEFKQAILNILSNAQDAINSNKIENGKIDILVYEEENQKCISIFNNGGNIPNEILDRIFEPYFTTKFETKGTGIGLYMTKTIIETSMGGEVFVKNKDNGVLFTIKLS